MKKFKKQNIIISVLVLLMLIMLFYFYNSFKERKIYIEGVKVENQEILKIEKKHQKKCIEDLIEYLNSEKYYNCKRIEFYNNTIDSSNNEKYFYALVIGNDYSLIEIENIDNDNFSFEYIGNEVTPNDVSGKTGVSYLQIINPDKYKRQKELEEIRQSPNSQIIDSIPKETEIDQ